MMITNQIISAPTNTTVKKINHGWLFFCFSLYGLAIITWASSLFLNITFNVTSSLPGTIYVIHKGAHFEKGDLVAYRWKGGATYPADTTFIKHVIGVPGDVVKRVGNAFWVNEQYIGVAKTTSLAGVPLQPADGGVIARGTYFMSTPSPDSLDSRYALSGNILQSEIIGKAYALF